MNQIVRNEIRRSNLFIIALIGALALTACGKQEAPPPPAAKPASMPAPTPTPPSVVSMTSVTSVTLGSVLGADGKVITSATTFAPKDTIYAVVTTNSTGTATATVAAKWTFGEGQLVNEGSQQIAANGAVTTTFHISKPDGFPAGKYAVAISIDGKPGNATAFEVK